MEVILLEVFEGLGTSGEIVKVKPGYARNFLFPRGIALRSSKKNRAISEERKRNKEGVFFGGQIVQPTSDYLTLYQGNNTIDTFYLDVNQRFEKHFDSLIPDLYKLEHVPESQNVLFEKGDSLWVRFNATTMKESLVYLSLIHI